MHDSLKSLASFTRFEIIRPLGSGGMGLVYLARDTELDRLVAIKCVDKKAGEDKLTKRLLSEARLMAKLNHPNIVQLYDVIESDKILGLVIEYVEGVDLSKKRVEAQADRKQCLHWLLQIAEGLTRAHASGIIHCDLKPENILISTEGIAKIADFGIAKAKLKEALKDDGLTEMGNVTGSYFSMSPEQASGKEVDYRTDLFSFGILIHSLLTGRHPFGKTQNHLVMVQRIVNDPFKLIHDSQSKLSLELSNLLNLLLEKDPNHRPNGAADVAVCLRNELKRESGEAIADEDLTIEMSAIQPKPFFSSINKAVALGFAVAVIGLLGFGLLGSKNSGQTLYIAATSPTVSSAEGADTDQIRRISATVEQSLQESILLTPSLSLIPDVNLQEYDGDLARFAKAVGANALISTSVDCSQNQCDLKLQKLVNQNNGNWVVSEQRSWPVLLNSLADIRNSVFSELPKLFPQITVQGSNAIGGSLAENDYRSYLAIHQATSAGTGGAEEDLKALAELRSQSPHFISVYSLYTEIAKHLTVTTGEVQYLDQLDSFLTSAPAALQATVAWKKLQFELLLQRGETESAQQLLVEVEGMQIDRVLLNDLRADLAYAQNDYQQTLQLDLENSQLIPSTTRHYKVAVSKYLLGDLEGAKESIAKALVLSPKHLYSLDLSGAIAFSEGRVSKAVEIYSKLVEINATSANLSNYGLALALSGQYSAASDVHSRAVNLNPNNPVLILNLADGYDLSNEDSLAKQTYQQVVNMTFEPVSAQYFSIRAQAQSHLGMHNEAIKTLREAQGKFPSIAEINFAAALVHTLAGNLEAAVVEVESAIETGTSAIWFRFHWFKELCGSDKFKALVSVDEHSLCTNGSKALELSSNNDN